MSKNERLMTDEDKLNKLVDDFSMAMRRKLLLKKHQGFYGWNDKSYRGVIGKKLMEHVERARKDPSQWVDVANFAAFLWKPKDSQ